MTAAGTDLFFIPGNDGREIYKLNPVNGSTQILAVIPTTDTKGIKKGASLTSDGSDKIYILEGSRGYGFYEVSTTGTLNALPSIPQMGTSGKKKKGKESALAYQDGIVYATKGAGTNEFFTYDIAKGKWDNGPDILYSLRKSGKGNSLVADQSEGVVYAIKGNKNNNFYEFTPIFKLDEEIQVQYDIAKDATQEQKGNETKTYNYQVIPTIMKASNLKKYANNCKIYDATGREVKDSYQAGSVVFLKYNGKNKDKIYKIVLTK